MTDSDRPTSTTPAAKLVAAQGVARANLVGQLTELAAVFCASALLHAGRLDQSNWMLIVGGALFGPVVARVRGLPAASSIITALVLVPPSLLAGAKAKGMLGLIVFGLSACVA